MTPKLPQPLGGAPPTEVSLARAPLVRVVAQVRFPDILKIDSKDAIAGLQEQIRDAYPLFEQQATQQIHLQVGAGEPVIRQAPGSNVWRFLDVEKNWRISLTTGFCTLECDTYASRTHFMGRWMDVLKAVEKNFDPRIVLRIGMRYVNQVKGEALESIEELIRPEILGIATSQMRPHVLHHLTEATLVVEEGEMLVRWGIVPANATIDPAILIGIPERSWILDVDVYSTQQQQFNSEELGSRFREFAEREYAVFRFVTTPRFLQVFGG
jgi:uncharacterized protein (TIGR04255 family)